MTVTEAAAKPRTIFISHRHADAAIADVLREFVDECTWRAVKIYQSSFPDNAPRAGRHLTQELREQLNETNVVLCIYTCQDEDWSYCMWECGVATDPVSDDTRVVVVQFSDGCPSPYSDQVRVDITERTSVKAFVKSFLTDCDFFPGFAEPLVPGLRPDDPQIARKAEELYGKLQELIPKEGQVEEWPAWAFLRIELAWRDVEKWKAEPDGPARLAAAKETLLADGLIVDGDRTARNLFGRAKFPTGMRFDDIVADWQSKYADAALDWVDSLAKQIMRAGTWQFPDPDWIAMRGASHGDTEWCIPILNWIRRMPQTETIQFDVYFVPVRRGTDTGEPQLRLAPSDRDAVERRESESGEDPAA